MLFAVTVYSLINSSVVFSIYNAISFYMFTSQIYRPINTGFKNACFNSSVIKNNCSLFSGIYRNNFHNLQLLLGKHLIRLFCTQCNGQKKAFCIAEGFFITYKCFNHCTNALKSASSKYFINSLS